MPSPRPHTCSFVFFLFAYRGCGNYWTYKVVERAQLKSFICLTRRFCFCRYCHWYCVNSRFCCMKMYVSLTKAIFVIRRKSFSVVLKMLYVKIQIFRDRSFKWVLNYFWAKFLEILTTGSLEIRKFLQRQSVSIKFFKQLRMCCIKLGSSVGCSRVPQVNFQGFQ